MEQEKMKTGQGGALAGKSNTSTKQGVSVNENAVNAVTTADLFALADNLRELREQKEDYNAILKDLNKDIDKAEYLLTEAMLKAECPNFTHNGKQFIMTSTTRWSAESNRKEELYAVLKEQGYEHLFTINAQTLGGFVRDMAEEYEEEYGENGLPNWLVGLVKSYADVGITMKAAGKKS